MGKEHHENGKLERNVLRKLSTSNTIRSVNSDGEIIDYMIIKGKVSRGNLKDGMLNGRGEIIDYTLRDEKREYKGTFKNNKLNGEGEIVHYYGNGNKCVEMKGTFRDMELVKGEIIFYDENGEVTRTTNF